MEGSNIVKRLEECLRLLFNVKADDGDFISSGS